MAKPSVPEKPSLRAVPLEHVRRARGQEKIPVPRSKLAATRAFRRIRTDRLLGVLGILLILFGTYLVFGWEKREKAPPVFPVEWEEVPHAVEMRTLEVTEATPEAIFSVAVDEPNLTRIEVRAFWKDDVGDEPREWDKLSFNLSGPAPELPTTDRVGQWADHETGNNLTPPLAVLVNELPNVRQVPAETESEARALIGDRTATNGTGEWRLRLHLDQLGDDFESENARQLFEGDCPADEVQGVCTTDSGQTVDVGATYWTFRLKLGTPP